MPDRALKVTRVINVLGDPHTPHPQQTNTPSVFAGTSNKVLTEFMPHFKTPSSRVAGNIECCDQRRTVLHTTRVIMTTVVH